MLAGACALVAMAAAPFARAADASQGAVPAAVNLAVGQTTAATATQTESVIVKAQKRLLKEKNASSAVTELGEKNIQQLGVSGNIVSLLRQAPSVYVYQQGIGNNDPVLSIRGTRGLETAQTLDGVPMQDLLNGGTGSYLENNVGFYFDLDQISGVHIYPGVAYPSENTFGTIGGTINYDSKRPTDDYFLDVLGSVGSFGTYKEGFTLNSGALDSPLGTGDNAVKLLLQYANLQSQGFIDYTPARYNNFMFALDKPYGDGDGSKFQATILYNTGNGLIQSEPTPLPYLEKYGLFANYAPNLAFQSQDNDYFTAIVRNDTVLNDYVTLGVTAMYRYSDETAVNYGNLAIFSPPGVPNVNIVGGAAPFVQNPDGFGVEGLYGPGGPFYDPQVYSYNGNTAYPVGSKYCPASVVAEFTNAGLTNPCGYNSDLEVTHNDTYSIQPRATIDVPEIFGISNTIKVGALIAKETEPATTFYLGGGPQVPQTAKNLSVFLGGSTFDGGTQRTIYEGYIQDKIDLLDNTLHVTPGVTYEGTFSSDIGSKFFYPAGAAALGLTDTLFAPYKTNKWDRDYLPFLNVSYDFDQILPMLRGLNVYGSTGQSALFAPTTDFSPNLLGTPPSASIVHLYEGGIQYSTPTLFARFDYFYQKVDRDFGFFEFQSGPLVGDDEYDNDGQREFKGVEGTVAWQITPEFELRGNFSHTLAKYLVTTDASATIAEDQFGIVTKGQPVTGVPNWLGNISIDYNKKNLFVDNDAAAITFGMQYTGHQATTYDLNGTQNLGYIPGVGCDCGSLAQRYLYYSATSGDTTYDPNGGINAFETFNLDLNYKLPTPQLPLLKSITFDTNIQNLFDRRYFAYFYKQISPNACGSFTSGPFDVINPQTGAIYTKSNYGCTPQFSDGLSGQPFSVFFTVTARF
jgi:iron complex outermembrane receptor protein